MAKYLKSYINTTNEFEEKFKKLQLVFLDVLEYYSSTVISPKTFVTVNETFKEDLQYGFNTI